MFSSGSWRTARPSGSPEEILEDLRGSLGYSGEPITRSFVENRSELRYNTSHSVKNQKSADHSPQPKADPPLEDVRPHSHGAPVEIHGISHDTCSRFGRAFCIQSEVVCLSKRSSSRCSWRMNAVLRQQYSVARFFAPVGRNL